MNRTDRLTGIMLELRGAPRTAAALAARFEVSRRTILRDIDALSQLGIPVIAISGPNGGYQLPDDYWLPALHFTDEEATALLFALRHLGGNESPFGDARLTAEQKLRAAISRDVLTTSDAELRQMVVLPPNHIPQADVVAALRNALKRRTWLLIHYRAPSGDSARVILPRTVYVAEGRWYTTALDSHSGERRTFRLDRIDGASRVPPPDNADELLARDRAPKTDYGDPSHPEIVIELTERGCRLARDLPDLKHLLPDDPEDDPILRWRCPPGELPYYARLLMRLETDVTILAPDDLRRLIVGMGETLIAHHATHTLSR